MNAPQTLPRWIEPSSSRVPFWAYTDAQLYRRELKKTFYGAHWCGGGSACRSNPQDNPATADGYAPAAGF